MAKQRYNLAFQLYSTRNIQSQEAVLDELARIGYDAVEPWLPDYEADPRGFRRRIENAGLSCIGFHMPFRGLVEEPQRFIDIAHEIGASLMIPPYLVPEDRPLTGDGWRRIGAQLGEGAERAAEAGLGVAWHNHEFEYKRLQDGTRPIDLILEAAGARVGFEIDFAWVTRAWASPLAELKRYASRIVAIQLKDTAPPGTEAEDGWTAAGDGIVPWEELWPLFDTTRADHLVVEHDQPTNWQVIAQRSFDFAASKGSKG